MLVALLCSVTSLGCPAVQVKPQPPAYGERCPERAKRFMFQELRIRNGQFSVTLDIHQPGEPDDIGVYREGPLLGRVEGGPWMDEDSLHELPVGTLLYGYLWEGHIDPETEREGVIAIYTKALLPDGREGPVCLWVGNAGSPWRHDEGSRPGAALLGRQAPVVAVSLWR
jgi:serine/threonine-protein kinase